MMTYEERKEIYESAIREYGAVSQIIVAIEEFSEITKELTKALRGEPNVDHIAEELADATIMAEQMRMVFDCNNETNYMMEHKCRRLNERVMMLGKRTD